MRHPVIVTVAVGLLAFAAGYSVRGLGEANPVSSNPDSNSPRPASQRQAEHRNDGGKIVERAATTEERHFQVSTRQLEAILEMGMSDPVAYLDEMGLTQDQIRQLGSNELWQRMEAESQALRLKHASRSEDSEGLCIEISPYVGERLQWLQKVESEVRNIVDDERTPIIARALVARSGHLQRGLLPQKIRFREHSGEPYLSEIMLGTDGSVFREDVHRVTDADRRDWGHLLELPAE